MSKNITDKQIQEIALKSGLTFKQLKTVILVESTGSGFQNNKLLIQFEPHVFHRQLATKKIVSALKFLGGTLYRVIVANKTIENKVDIQSKEYEAFEKAISINEDAAYMATSFGMGQIMGFNYKLCGYKSAKEMALDFEKGEYQQVEAMIQFIKANSKMFNALKASDWAGFAYYYNGVSYKKFSYDTKLADAYKKL